MDIKISETDTTILKEKKVVGTQITQEMYQKLKKESEENFMSISDLLRKIIYLYYKNQSIEEKKGN